MMKPLSEAVFLEEKKESEGTFPLTEQGEGGC